MPATKPMSGTTSGTTTATTTATTPAAPTARLLDELLCFDLYAASRAVTALYRPMLEELGLTYPQYLVLVTLPPGESVTVRQIATWLSLDHGTLTPMLRRMESAGLLTRRRGVRDERVVEISLTERGERVRERFENVQCAVGDAMGLPGEEFRRLQLALRALTASVRHATDEPPIEVSDR